MDSKTINRFPIREYLAGLNMYPAKERGYYGMYHSPFREDHDASMKVDYNKNLWIDYGTNEGGTLIDLVMRIARCSNGEAMRLLEQKLSGATPFSFQGKTIPDEVKSDTPAITIQNIIPITHPKLTAWVQERKINLDLANLYCREIHYRNRDKEYFAIGFKNDNDGYELSIPPNFKGCIAPKEITTIRNNSDTCLVFESFWDFLSYLAIQKIEKSKHDVAILNSVANVQKAMNFLKSHKDIYTYLDNDEAGRKATELIKSNCVSVNNCSERYARFKDLNDYLRGRIAPKQTIKQKPHKGLKM